MKSEDDLWDTGKEDDTSSSNSDDDSSTLDLSETSPEKDEKEINLAIPEESEAIEKDEDWAIPLAEDVDGLNLRTIGIVGTVVILLLTGTLFFLLNETNAEIEVPNERYDEQINYNVNGFLNFDSNLDVPIPFGFFDNDIVINNLDVVFQGELSLGIEGPRHVEKNGYGETKNSLFRKYIEQDLDDVDGTITEEGSEPAELKNSNIKSTQDQYVDSSSLNIIRSDIVSNASTAKISGIGQRWAWQSATDWIPRQHSSGILPHGNAYIGKTLTVGDSGTLYESGIQFTTKVDKGEKIKDYDTVKIQIMTSYVSDSLLGYEYEYSYTFSFYMSEVSSLPLKFEMRLTSEAKSPGAQLYSIDLKYTATAKDVFEGNEFVPTKNYDSVSPNSEGEFLAWDNGAPALGTSCDENSQLNGNFNLQSGIAEARNNISSFDNYIKDQQAKKEEAFVIEANFSSNNDNRWNFTMAHSNEQSQKVDGWIVDYRQEKINGTTFVNGTEKELDNPILKMEEIDTPLTVCSAENLMTDFEEIADWAIDKNTNNVNYETTTLILGQNLISEQSLSSPTSILDFGNLDLISAISDLNSGNWNFNDYSNNIDVDTAGSYAYFLDRSGGSDSLGYDYQEVAGIDAKNGLVMFNLQSKNAL
ncbi:MAG: hypothetical protein BD935_04295 [Marine Group III euryarchaeote CG-Epi1]|uniref:Uncharacterized protein n=1 Tax=Marine Group III euryarchaeote CG-Epi1 TaxID=1888995 RepID=A0A1J5TIW8_9ARCH|nr:MAG: hypothetical protein BD935_04295 [Marine Group III euryarchaeote CG-Epi1]